MGQELHDPAGPGLGNLNGHADPAAHSPRAYLRTAKAIADDVAAKHATDVDRRAVFPTQTVSALAEAGLLSAVVPRPAGGLGLDLSLIVRVASILGRGCGSSAMIWAMHQMQLACLVRHGALTTPTLAGLLDAIVAENLLLASVTSEKGSGSSIHRSHAAVEPDDVGLRLHKEAPTVSYGAQAGFFLIPARRDPQAEPEDQVAVIVRRDQVSLQQVGGWNPMGMRGTCSPPLRIEAHFDRAQILPDPFGVVAAHTLVPLSQILWSAVWIGMATEALSRAARAVEARSSRSGTNSVDRRMAEADQILTSLEAQLDDAVRLYHAADRGAVPRNDRFKTRMNALKIAASTSTVQVAQLALGMCGIAGYLEDGPLSVARMLRDLYSGQVMVSNDWLIDANAAAAVSLRR
ncbi:acyl-CoA dehydrogenase family protein [Micromonospora sp. NPDC049662]|uniref:acyl-CoA dehydrogenase family protein n=1 Tax=Micromonospora sp. NPDC049662 TaxID=3155397 RepID=UPI0034246D6C